MDGLKNEFNCLNNSWNENDFLKITESISGNENGKLSLNSHRESLYYFRANVFEKRNELKSPTRFTVTYLA